MADTVLIGGGVGPMAGVVLHRKVIENTATNGTDQDHLEVMHLSRSPIIADRTEFLSGEPVADPVEGMLRVFRMAEAALRTEERRAVAGVPCNTFHAASLFSRFRAALEKEGMSIRVLHMLAETAAFIRATEPRAHRVGVLSTTGTRSSGVYEEIFADYGLEVAHIPLKRQAELHEAIYHREWGLKALSVADERAATRVREFASLLVSQGADAVVLGCTELPLALAEGRYEGVPVVDPMTALARALVREAAPEKLIAAGQ